MTFKLFNFSLSIFVSLSLFSLSWSFSHKAKISEKKHFFSLRSEKKIGVFSLIFALSENERRTLVLPSPCGCSWTFVWVPVCVVVVLVHSCGSGPIGSAVRLSSRWWHHWRVPSIRDEAAMQDVDGAVPWSWCTHRHHLKRKKHILGPSRCYLCGIGGSEQPF